LIIFTKNIKVAKQINCNNEKSVSIIVCARNEQKNIDNLMGALFSQDYDISKIEYIFANDGSTDETERLLKEYAMVYNICKYFNVSGRDNAISPKKNALNQAIDKAKGEIILLTDADCIPSKTWVSSHIAMYETNPDLDMVVGFAKTKLDYSKPTKICQKFEYLDFLVLMFATRGAIQSGIPFACSGQNLSYKRNSFFDVGGFSGIDNYLSGDDLLLMQKFIKNKKKIGFTSFTGAFTETYPVNNWKELFNQRARWASNIKPVLRMNFKFFIYLVACFVCIGITPFTLILYLIKTIFDAIFINYSCRLFKKDNLLEKVSISNFGIWFILCPFYMLAVTFLGMCSRFQWQDRRG
jgi:cellulose synthase/poly-beta-1,6-N-acetylglucosamine synthase-like glycosyltransferase